MNIIDIAIIGFVILSGFIGLTRGLTREVLGLFTWLGAAIITYLVYPHVLYIAEGYFSNATVASGVTIAAVFILSVILLNIISQLISSVIQESALGGIDRSLGFVFGLLRAVVFLAAAELIVSSFLSRSEYPRIFKDAFVSDHIYQASDTLASILPPEVTSYIGNISKSKMNKKIEQSFDDVMNKATKDDIEEVAPESNNHSTTDNSSNEINETSASTEENNSENQSEVESLARLKPKDTDEPDKTISYNKSQKQQLDRLVQTLQN